MAFSSKKLRMRMAARDYTPERLAQELGVSFYAVASWLRGERIPRRRLWGKIENILGDDMFEDDSEPAPTPKGDDNA